MSMDKSSTNIRELLYSVEQQACRARFFEFVKSFWDVIIKEDPVYNWHIEYLCDELQELTKFIVAREPKPYDIIINIPPGTSKSTIVTIMWPAWMWTQDASIRIITNSYSSDLSIEHSTKSRDIITSDKYKRLFPEVELRRDKSGKGSYENTSTGARYSTSTGGTITGKHAHCLVGSTKVKTAQGLKPLKDIRVGDFVLSYHNGVLEYNRVVATSKTTTHELYELKIGRNTVRATGNHRFFILGKGYTEAKDIKCGDICYELLLGIESIDRLSTSTVTSINRYRCNEQSVFDIQVEKANNFFAESVLVHNCIINDDPQNPKQADSEPLREQANEHTKTLSSRKVNKKNTPTVTIMQRLHTDDVTGYLLSKKGDRIKHICLPAELSDNVKPDELKKRYVDGLLDPLRLDRDMLAEAKVDLGSVKYAGQYEQSPTVEGGNIIKEEWFGTIPRREFDRLRQNEPIVFFADTAYTEKSENDPSGIIATCKVGNTLYITKAQKVNKKFPDLVRFIPRFAQENGYDSSSAIRIEPKANGISVIDQLRELTGLNVTKTPTPTDSKETRLNAASPTVECGRVVLVIDTWNDDFIGEVCGFPNKPHDEYVDLLCYAIDHHINGATQAQNLSGLFF